MWTKAGKTSDILPGASLIIEAGGKKIAVFNVEGRFCAILNVCPHRGGPLGEGSLEDKTVTCPWHAWHFDVTTGVCANVPGVRQPVFATKVEAGELYVEV